MSEPRRKVRPWQLPCQPAALYGEGGPITDIRSRMCSRRNSVPEAARRLALFAGPRAPCCGPYCAQTVCGWRWCRLHPPSPGLPIAIAVDVHYVPEASMRLVASLAMCLILILANAAQAGAQAPSGPQAYCVNGSADFYPYTGEPCKSGYQLGSGNCRKSDGRMVAVPREECLAQAGIVEVHFFYDGRPAAPPPAPRR
jgi:hypothetical protein